MVVTRHTFLLLGRSQNWMSSAWVWKVNLFLSVCYGSASSYIWCQSRTAIGTTYFWIRIGTYWVLFSLPCVLSNIEQVKLVVWRKMGYYSHRLSTLPGINIVAREDSILTILLKATRALWIGVGGASRTTIFTDKDKFKFLLYPYTNPHPWNLLYQLNKGGNNSLVCELI